MVFCSGDPLCGNEGTSMEKQQIGNNFFIPMPDNRYWTLGKYAGDAWSAGKKQKQ